LRDDFKALMMAMPGQAVIEAASQGCDPVAVFAARDHLRALLGQMLHETLSALLTDEASTARQSDAAGRHFQNALLDWAIASGDAHAAALAEAQVQHENMSLSKGALTALNRKDTPERTRAMQAFHDRWQNDSLVMEKWFALSASAPETGTIAHIRTLMAHPAFDQNSPNKLRSVLGVFCAANVTQFHADDGAGYEFIADELIKLDKRNPQIAARMALSLTRMSAYDGLCQARMKTALEKVYENATSRDLSEVVGKALGR